LFKLVSFKKKATAINSINQAVVINQKGAFTQRFNHKSNQPTKGQIIKPTQNKAQIIHILLILSFLSFEISDIIELIILIFHQVIQLIILASMKILYVEVIAISRLDINVPIRQKKSVFFLPNISDNCHKTGQDKNEKKA